MIKRFRDRRLRRAEDQALAEWCRTHRLVVVDPDWPGGQPAPLVNIPLDSLRLMLRYNYERKITQTVFIEPLDTTLWAQPPTPRGGFRIRLRKIPPRT